MSDSKSEEKTLTTSLGSVVEAVTDLAEALVELNNSEESREQLSELSHSLFRQAGEHLERLAQDYPQTTEKILDILSGILGDNDEDIKDRSESGR